MQWMFRHRWLWLALAIATLMRVYVWVALPRTGFISDESEYLAAATWIAYGRGFAWYLDHLWTRAPLYPLFIAAHISIGGTAQWTLVTQAVLSLSHVGLVWLIARRIWPQQPPVADVAAMLTSLALPLAVMPFTFLSETIYITFFLLILWVALGYQIAAPSTGRAVIIGGLLGLATLTRGLTLAFVPFVLLWMYFGGGRLEASIMRQRLGRAVLTAVVFVLAVAPWSYYASRTFGGVVLVDTTGAYNLLLRAHAGDQGTIDAVKTNAYVQSLISADMHVPSETCLPHPGVLDSQVARQSAILGEAVCIIGQDVETYIGRMPAEFVDFWQIRYTSAERFSDGFTSGSIPWHYATALLVFDDVWYMLIIVPALFGLWVMRRDGATRSQHELYLLWSLLPVVLSVALFSITRFRVMLLPLWAVSAAGCVVWLSQGNWRAVLRPLPGAVLAGSLLVWSLVATPVSGLVPPSFFGALPSAWQCYWLALRAAPQAANSDEYARMLHNNPWLMPVPDPLPSRLAAVAPILQAYWQGRITDVEQALNDGVGDGQERAIIRGDLARRQERIADARKSFRMWYVEERDSLPWAWRWLPPTTATRIDVGDGADVGMITGCYRPEFDAQADRWGRWCGDGTRLRFAEAGSGFVQKLHLVYDVRGWPSDVLPTMPIEIWLENALIGTIDVTQSDQYEVVIDLPVMPVGHTLEIELRGPTFVPSAAAFRAQNAFRNQQVVRYMILLDSAWIEQ